MPSWSGSVEGSNRTKAIHESIHSIEKDGDLRMDLCSVQPCTLHGYPKPANGMLSTACSVMTRQYGIEIAKSTINASFNVNKN